MNLRTGFGVRAQTQRVDAIEMRAGSSREAACRLGLLRSKGTAVDRHPESLGKRRGIFRTFKEEGPENDEV